MQILVVVSAVAVGLLLIFGIGNGLQWLSVRRQINRLRREGRAIVLGVAVEKVLNEGFVFVEDKRTRPTLLWVLEEALTSCGTPVEVALQHDGLLVEEGGEAVERLKRDPAIAARMLVSHPGVFVD